MKLLSTAIALLATVAMISLGGMSMTGCTNPVDAKDSVGAAVLTPPISGSVLVLSATTAKIMINASNNESDFRGYILYGANGTDSVATIDLTAAFSPAHDTVFNKVVTIDQDVISTWKVAAFNKSGEVSTKLTVTFNPRNLASVVVIKSSQAGQINDGLNIDVSPVALVNVDDAIKTAYTDASGADFVLEAATNNDSAFITPVNGAAIINLASASTLLDTAQITAAFAQVNKTAVAAGGAGAYIFKSGSSVRVGGTGALVRPAVGNCYLLVSATGKYARLVVAAVSTTTDNDVTLNVYTPAVNGEGSVVLYKK
ncbi:MAG: hypothetical protein V1913_07770 [Fibrobacterota bacterium]